MNQTRSLRWALYAGSIYFLGISICHGFGWKMPGFYIYFDVDSTTYQDWIISLLAFGWSIFLYAAGHELPTGLTYIRAVLFAGLVALAGLTRINLWTDFSQHGTRGETLIYWIEVGALFLYLAVLVFLYIPLHNQSHGESST